MLCVPFAVTHCAGLVTPCACPGAQAYQEFWDMVAAANCTLISVDESGDGDVTQADADAVSLTLSGSLLASSPCSQRVLPLQQFFAKDAPVAAAPAPPPAPAEDEDEDMFSDMD